MAVSQDGAECCAETLNKVNLHDIDCDGDAPVEVKPLNTGMWRPLSEEPSAAQFLSSGHGFFSFSCTAGASLLPEPREFVRLVVNLSRFKDEAKENHTPPIDPTDNAFMAAHQAIVVKATYALPGVDPSKLTAELLSSVEYHEKCQPGPPTVEADPDLVPLQTVRFTKALVKMVFYVTVQLTVSVITDEAVLDSLAGIDGRRPTHAVLMERTKKDIHKQDSTVKCKSLLLYHAVDGGVVCTNVSVVINSVIPHVVAAMVNTFGNNGAYEVKETMMKSRRYLVDTIGDTRDPALEKTKARRAEKAEKAPKAGGGYMSKLTGGWF